MDTAQTATPADAGQGPAPEAPTAPVETTAPEATPTPEVQPASEATTQPDGGQGLIAPYLEGVDEAHRDVVADALEKYRKDSDANVTKRFEELNAYKEFADSPDALEAPVYLYERLMSDPVETIRWVFDRFQEEANVDLRSQLLAAQEGVQDAAPESEATPADDDPNRPLTVAEWQKLQQEQAAEQQRAAETAQRRQQAETWFNEAAQSHGLELDAETDVAVRHAILTHAAQLLPQFQQQPEPGKAAIQTAVEAFTNRYGKAASAAAEPTTPEPKTANGGTPPAPDGGDLSDPKARKAFMHEWIKGLNTQE